MSSAASSLRASRPVVLFAGIGLLLMALFTMSWALWSLVGLPIGIGVGAVIVFGALATIYLMRGIGLVWSSGTFPAASSDDRTHRRRTLQLGYGITFGSEGLVIGAVSGLLIANDAAAYLQPSIALIVGLHFVPFGFLFRRRIDFSVAGWVVTCAVLGIWSISSRVIPAELAGALVSLATAGGTATYGLYLLHLRKVMTVEAR